MTSNENQEMCASCDDSCCKRCPGICFPEDFGSNRTDVIAAVKAALDSGRYCIDWWEGDPRYNSNYDEKGGRLPDRMSSTNFIRPAEKGEEGRLRHPLWVCKNGCTFLLSTGCELSFEQRPLQCRALVPKEDKECSMNDMYSKQSAAIAWIPYHEWLNSLGRA